MEEQVVKKRGWVKNAVIAFLSIMLVLTFFSNTIMNRSLPEVATAFVESGTINAKIRGSGTVSAGESYDVVMDQTRKVSSVLVKVGDLVETGDVLFTLSETESDELKQAQDTLEDMRLNYQKSVLNMDSADYAQENRNIQKAREALTEAKAEMENCAVSDDQIYQAQMTLKEAQRAKKDLEDALKKLQDLEAQITAWEKECETLSDAIDGYEKQIRSLKAGTGNLAGDLKNAKDELKACQKTYADLRITYGADYEELKKEAQGYAADNADNDDIVIQMAALVKTKAPTDKLRIAFEKLQPAVDAVDAAQAKVDTLQALVDGQSSVQAQISQLEEALSKAEDDYSSRKKDIKSAKRELGNLDVKEEDWYEQQIDSAGENVETLSDQYDQLKQLKSNYKAAEERVKDCQNSLDDLLFALAEQKKADGKTAASQQLDLEKARKDIQEQEERVAELKANALGAEVTAKVSGQISSLNVTAGRDAGAGETLAVIEVVDRGYTVRLPVTIEQSQKVRLGDKASVTNYYWGQQIDATLTQIINDPSNPGKGKLLVFTLTGDISSGQNVTLSVGEKSANYDAIVPNSALRTDTNGTFVLVVMAKSSPLGNRYIATRVDVQVLAQDDTTAAVSGLSFGDYVITTSSKPLEAGMQVNMVEN